MDLKQLDEAYLLSEQDLQREEVFAIGAGSVAVFSSKSPDRESPNEDSVALIPINETSCVLAVADGAGGLRGGAKASNIAVTTLAETVRQAARDGMSLRESIINAFEQSDANIKALGLGAATTLAVVELSERTVRSYHVGDSLIIVAGQRGKIKWQTIAHSPVGYAVEAGVLDETEAMHHKDRHLVSNFLGSEMRIDIGPSLPLAELDTIVIASDGLSDNLSIDEIVEHARQGALGDVARRMAETCRARMLGSENGRPSKPDDLTFVVFRLKRNGRERSPAPT